MSEVYNLKLKEIDAEVIEKCPECGGDKFLEVTFFIRKNKRKDDLSHKKGLKCFSCGILLIKK